MSLTSNDFQEVLYALYGVRERIQNYAHGDYETHMRSLEPIEQLIVKVRAARDEAKQSSKRGDNR